MVRRPKWTLDVTYALAQPLLNVLGIIFALIPATEAETTFEIDQISQQIADTESEITINVNNSHDNEVTYSLSMDIFSKDLQDSISIDNPTKIFSLDSMSDNTANFSYLSPMGGHPPNRVHAFFAPYPPRVFQTATYR